MTFEQLDRSIDADSDSEDEAAEQAHAYRLAQEKGKAAGGASEALAGLRIGDKNSPKLPKPPARPAPPSDDEDSVEEEDENNPFGDRNAVQPPHVEKGVPKWR